MDQAVNLITKRIQRGDAASKRELHRDTFHYEPPGTDERVRRGTLFILAEIYNRSEEDLDLVKLSQSIFNKAQEEYMHKHTGGPLETLELAYRSAIEHGQMLSQNKAKITLACVAIWGKSIVYANPSLLPILIRRDHELFELDQPQFGTELIKNADLLIVSTSNLYEGTIKPLAQDYQTADNSSFTRHIEQALQATADAPTEYATGFFIQIEIKQVPGEEEIIEIHYPAEYTQEKPNPLMTSLKSLPSQLGSALGKLIPRRIKSPNIYLRPGLNNKGKKLALIFAVFGFLTVSIFATYLYQDRKQVATDYHETLDQISENLSQAEQLSQINPQESLSLLDEASSAIDNVLGAQDLPPEQVTSFTDTISTIRTQIYREKEITLTPLQLSPEVQTKQFSLNADGVYDFQGNQILGPAAEWNSPIRAATYFDNLYLLDPAANQIWKYLGTGATYHGPQAYLQEEAQLQDALDLAIDGSVYVLFPDKVDRFTLGKRDSFAVQGVFPTISTASRITTEPDSTNFYISTSAGIAVFNNDGFFQNLLVNSNLANTQEIISADQGTRLYVLANDSWWEIDLTAE